LQAELRAGGTVTEALYSAGYAASSRMYEESGEALGMTPTAFKKGGAGQVIRYATAKCALGQVIVCGTERGVCLIAFADTDKVLVAEARTRFPDAEIRKAEAGFADTVAKVVAMADNPAAGGPAMDLPLDVRGTAFQRRVWQELRAIPAGSTATYAELAARIGKPKAVRAVGTACGANPVSLLVPCHRAVGTDGKLHGYRWGLKRKRQLLDREATARKAGT
jgi:AraC family transcriptional regulator of adaptative response/methylated-DNA-[protein]-cysteine methyltransferase